MTEWLNSQCDTILHAYSQKQMMFLLDLIDLIITIIIIIRKTVSQIVWQIQNISVLKYFLCKASYTPAKNNSWKSKKKTLKRDYESVLYLSPSSQLVFWTLHP